MPVSSAFKPVRTAEPKKSKAKEQTKIILDDEGDVPPAPPFKQAHSQKIDNKTDSLSIIIDFSQQPNVRFELAHPTLASRYPHAQICTIEETTLKTLAVREPFMCY